MEIEQKKMRTFFGGQMRLLFFLGGRTVTGREFFTIPNLLSMS